MIMPQNGKGQNGESAALWPSSRSIGEERPLSERAIEMRAAGCSYGQIAERLGVTRSTAHGYVKREIARQRAQLAESREDIRDLDLHKLAWLERRLMQASREGDWQAAKLMLTCIQLRKSYMMELPIPMTLDDLAAIAEAKGLLNKTDSIPEIDPAQSDSPASVNQNNFDSREQA